MEAKPRRQQLIARLPGLKKLNGSRVTETEKEEAERAFIRLYLDSDNPPARWLPWQEYQASWLIYEKYLDVIFQGIMFLKV